MAVANKLGKEFKRLQKNILSRATYTKYLTKTMSMLLIW